MSSQKRSFEQTTAVVRLGQVWAHEGSIVPDAPNARWGTDGTMAWTIEDGWVWVFDLIDHHSAEAWAHVAKVGGRFAALQTGL